MVRAALAASILLLTGLTAAQADERPKVEVRTLLSTQKTSTGQPLVLPQRNAQVIVSEYVIAPGTTLPVHKHPFPRYAIVLEGSLRVARPGHDEAFDYKAGDVVIEMVDQWHYGINTGDVPVRLIVIDQVEAGSPATILKDK